MTRMTQAPADAVASHWFEALPPGIKPWAQLMRLDRPIGTWLLFWPCVMGLVLGAIADERNFTDWRDLYYVALFGLGAVIMRGAGCAFNDIMDRDYDAQVARTAGRPIPSGRISVKEAWGLVIALCLWGLLILQQFNDMSLDEIAGVTAVSVETVKSRLRYAMQKLRLHMQNVSTQGEMA